MFLLIVLMTLHLFCAHAVTQCDFRGKQYPVGASFQPSPCEHCFCAPDGQTPCAVVDCPMMMCADPVNDPSQCCPSCPNGATCEVAGHIIKPGEVYHLDAHTTCSCADSHVGFIGLSRAICSKTIS